MRLALGCAGSDMRANIRKLVARLDTAFPLPEPIYEFGAREVAGQELRAIRPLFAGREYLGCDLEPGPGVDRILDLERLSLPDASIGSAIALDTLEHVERFWTVGPELHRVLRPGGIAVLSSVMYFPIHEHPARSASRQGATQRSPGASSGRSATGRDTRRRA